MGTRLGSIGSRLQNPDQSVEHHIKHASIPNCRRWAKVRRWTKCPRRKRLARRYACPPIQDGGVVGSWDKSQVTRETIGTQDGDSGRRWPGLESAIRNKE